MARFHPIDRETKMLPALLICAYATGLFSSRKVVVADVTQAANDKEQVAPVLEKLQAFHRSRDHRQLFE